jgi:protein-tyrosine phosphatase
MALDCSEVIPGRLWIGGFVRNEDVPRLAQMGITDVICLQSDEDLLNCGLSPRKLLKHYTAAGIRMTRNPVEDFNKAVLADRLPECVATLENALASGQSRVYMHCTAGINRSATVAAAYLIKSGQMSAGDAFRFLAACRRCSPYLSLLEAYESSIRAV